MTSAMVSWAGRAKGQAWLLAQMGVQVALSRIKTGNDLMLNGLGLMLFIFSWGWGRVQFLKIQLL